LSANEQAGGTRDRPQIARLRVRTLGGRRIFAEGLESNLWKDLYFNAMTASWPALFAALAAAFVGVNLLFALVYDLGEAPIANARGLADLFFFSVETTSTVGYGDMHPQSDYGHIVAASENFIGMMLLAVMTGLVFARISRPRARILFSKNPVVAPHDGVPTLMFRLANARSNFISEATAKTWIVRPIVSEEGRRLVGFEPLRLLKSENPTLALSWMLFHPIDAASPLFGMDGEAMAQSEVNFVVSIVGYDETSSQTVHARNVFAAQDVRFGQEYEDIVWIDDDGMRHINYGNLDKTRPTSNHA
jgi:inward rectifier potassium channel